MTDIEFRVHDDEDGAAHHARLDAVEGLGEWFTPIGGDPIDAWRVRTDVVARGPLTNGSVEVVAWRYRADADPDVWGVAAEHGPIEIDGVTYVDQDAADGPNFVRYIDWHGIFTQLGVAAAGHIVSSR